MEFEQGDRVRICERLCGYVKGDIGRVVGIFNEGRDILVFVEGRVSTSGYTPLVNFNEYQLELVDTPQHKKFAVAHSDKLADTYFKLEDDCDNITLVACDSEGNRVCDGYILYIEAKTGKLHLCASINKTTGLALSDCGRIVLDI